MNTTFFSRHLAQGWYANHHPRLLACALLVHLALVLIGLLIAIPLYWTVISSLTTNAMLFTGGISWFPLPWHFENFSQALQAAPFGLYLLNSTFVALVVTAITL